jgi:hypothetical protein
MCVMIVSRSRENKEVTIVDYIHECSDIVIRARIQDQLLKVNGIVSVEFDNFRPHLLCVEYIPTLIQSSVIMSLINEHNLHPHLIVGI